MENIIRALETELAAKKRDVEKLERMLNEARDDGNYAGSIMASAEQAAVSKNQFTGMACGDAIRLYLQHKGSGAYLDEIREALLRGGLDMGMYPRRSVKLAVVNNSKRFGYSGDAANPFVTLKN